MDVYTMLGIGLLQKNCLGGIIKADSVVNEGTVLTFYYLLLKDKIYWRG
jgi:hypothetical protein